MEASSISSSHIKKNLWKDAAIAVFYCVPAEIKIQDRVNSAIYIICSPCPPRGEPRVRCSDTSPWPPGPRRCSLCEERRSPADSARYQLVGGERWCWGGGGGGRNAEYADAGFSAGPGSSVADPDPYVFGSPGSGSFYHQAKIVRKTLIPTVLWLFYDFLSLKNYKSSFEKYKQKNLEKK